jgi:2-polyprenyl-3-methyl-5-hydroxy-6-metoxy-1,4-benzoquinol methylase
MNCYLCNKPTYTYFQIKNRIIFRCNTCELTYTSNNYLNIDIDKEGSKKFVDEYVAEEELYKEYFNGKIQTYIKDRKPKLLLDIGCGAGIFLDCVNKLGWKSIGVDSSKAAIKYSKLKGLNVKLGKIEQLKLNPNSFDVITIFQTIEHLDNPLKIMQKVNKLLRPNGIFLLTTPNENSFMAKIMGKKWFGYRNIEHIFFYNQNSLKLMLIKAGFKEVNITEENGRSMSLTWILIRLFGYYYNHHSIITKFILKTNSYWKYLKWIKFCEPKVNLVSIAIK